jgi:hypothetical protein
LLRERLRSILRGPPAAAGSNGISYQSGETGGSRMAAGTAMREASHTRASRGLEQFFSSLRDLTGLGILDLSGAHQENINFITSLGHKFYSEDFLRIYQEVFANDPASQANPGQIEYFLRQSLDYPEEQFDGVLAWDTLEYLSPPLLAATVDRLLATLKPKGYLLAFFNSPERAQQVPCYTFRIQDLHNLRITQSGQRLPEQLFNNRSLEKLFQKFESVKFFLTREHLREVIVRK